MFFEQNRGLLIFCMATRFSINSWWRFGKRESLNYIYHFMFLYKDSWPLTLSCTIVLCILNKKIIIYHPIIIVWSLHSWAHDMGPLLQTKSEIFVVLHAKKIIFSKMCFFFFLVLQNVFFFMKLTPLISKPNFDLIAW